MASLDSPAPPAPPGNPSPPAAPPAPPGSPAPLAALPAPPGSPAPPAALPAPLDRWTRELLGQDPPAERRATCEDCGLRGERARAEGLPAALHFSPSRCCTYVPTLPSFSVGLILADPSSELRHGRELIERAVAERRMTTPLGLLRPPAAARAYRDEVDKAGFGRTTALSCPFLDSTGGCSIWRYRDAICASWFCRFEGGAARARFWRTLSRLLGRSEHALAWHLVEQLDPGDDAVAELLESSNLTKNLGGVTLRGFVDAEGRMSEELARRVWGRWYGREREFYRRCAEAASALSWRELSGLGGSALGVLARLVRLRFAAMARRPELLVLGPVATEGEGELVYLRSDELPYDGISLPQTLVEALKAFDGRPLSEARAEAEARSGAPLDDALLARLITCGALVEPDGRDLPPGLQREGPIEQDERLCFFRGYQQSAVESRELVLDGRAAVVVVCGHKEITFSEPDLLTFARELCRHAWGFEAGAATRWTEAGELSWERVRGLLEALVSEDVLQRQAR